VSQEIGDIQKKRMTLLKKQLLQYSEGAKRPLKIFLSTIYGRSMVAQGYAALLMDSLDQMQSTRCGPSTLQFQERMKTACIQSSLLLEAIQDLSELTGEIEDLLEDETPSSRN